MALAAQTGPPGLADLRDERRRGRRGRRAGRPRHGPGDPPDELRCACQALGIEEPIFLGYRDSGMENWTPKPGAFVLADRDEVVERIAAEMRRLRPAVVVTFDPGGGYGHPDHTRVSEVATAAFERVHAASRAVRGSSTTRCLRVPRPRSAWSSDWAKNDTKPDGKPPTEDDLLQRRRFVELARPDEEITTRVDVRAVIDRKLAALACHASQLRDARFDEATIAEREAWLGTETFVRVVPPPEPGERETALLAL